MNTFLKQVSSHIYESHNSELDQIAIIIPNKRAAIYIQKHLAELFNKPFLAPKIITINEWIETETAERILSQTELLFVFYTVYLNYEKSQADSFDDFIKWAKLILSDFDEIDRYMISPKLIFRDLKNIKDIDNWSFNNEPLNSEQLEFLNLWEKLPKYYTLLADELKAKKSTYQGKAYQKFAKKCELQLIDCFKHYYFIGFNAFSQAEQDIVSALKSKNVATVMFDVDKHYVDNIEHEAGHFYRKLRAAFAPTIKVPDLINSKPKQIEIIETAQQVAQTKYAGYILKSFSESEINNTAVVLADESLLIPLSRSLPASIKKANITMGYPLKYSHLKSLIDSVFDFQQNIAKFGENKLYHKTVLQFLDHSYIQQLINNQPKIDAFKADIIRKNQISLNPQQLFDAFSDLKKIDLVFKPWENCAIDGLKTLKHIIQTLYDAFKNQSEAKSIELEILYHFSKGITKFETIYVAYKYELSIKSFKKLTYQFWQNESLSFLGNPTKGLQVMGILETRTLDFENIFILGLNEGNLPKNNFSNSMLVRELKLYHHLPVEEDRDAIFAHHFYRLLHRAKRVYLTYNSNGEGLGNGEKSRFITQLENELDTSIGHQINHRTYSGNDKESDTENTVYKLDQASEKKLDNLFKRGLSPSALNTFLRCPLDFYYTYILNLREDNEVEESIEASTFGSMIHHVLERIFKDQFLIPKKPIDIKILEQEKKKLTIYLTKEYLTVFNKKDIEYGQNKLSFEISIKFLSDFIDLQIKELKQIDFPIFIHHLETDIETEFEWDINGIKKTIKLKGQADRIDQFGSEYRIIDYKSGKCNSDKVLFSKSVLNSNGFEPVFSNKDNKQAYGIQLLMYATMFNDMFPDKAPFKAGIISMINLKNWIQNVGIKDEESLTITPELLNEFKTELKHLIEKMYDPNFEFTHNPNSKFCDYCGN